MLGKKHVLTMLVLAVLLLGVVPAEARKWPDTAGRDAGDYSIIIDAKISLTMVFWLNNPIAAPLVEKMPALQDALDKYVVIGAMNISSSIGEDGKPIIVLNADNAPVVRGGDGAVLAPVEAKDVPPEINLVTSAMQMMLRNKMAAKAQNDASHKLLLAEAGKSLRFYFFENNGVNSCAEGQQLYVDYAGKTYSYQTPIPGCKTP